MYLYGRPFILETDHKPLTHIFGAKDVPTTAAARMQRWALILSGYQYQIQHRQGKDNCHADMLSRFPVDSPDTADPDERYIHHTVADDLPITAKEIKATTAKDPVLSKVLEYCMTGWPSATSEGEIQSYHRRREELSVEDGILLWGRRVIVPKEYHQQILEELHLCHPGMCRMKALARSYIWWPNLDEDIENKVRYCEDCNEIAQPLKKLPLLLWPWTSAPMQRIHMDYLEIEGQAFHLIVDTHSKWIEVYPMNTTTSKATISTVQHMISRYGLPDRIITDNGP
jgi:hypothetical protein